MSSLIIKKIDIIKVRTDCMVNAANEHLQRGGGVCGAIFKACGGDDLQRACNAIGVCKTGNAVITPAFNLDGDVKHIIHAVGPIWVDGQHGEEDLLYKAYWNSLELVKKYSCHTVVFPLISSGIFGMPVDLAWKKALEACYEYFRSYPAYDIDVTFAILSDHIIAMGKRADLEVRRNLKIEKGTYQKANVMTYTCTFFWHPGEANGELSNFYRKEFVVEDFRYFCMEQYMMAQKARLFHDSVRYTAVLRANTPEECKALGRKVTPFDSDLWDSKKYDIVKTGVRAKFSQNEDLKKLLLATGDSTLAEANPNDKVWGVALKAEEAAVMDPFDWPGQNLLGQILMKVRAELR